MIRCPVCGAANGGCGDTPLVLPPVDLARPADPDELPRVPQQIVRKGQRAGYKGRVIVVPRQP